jgi:hypothetical protein
VGAVLVLVATDRGQPPAGTEDLPRPKGLEPGDPAPDLSSLEPDVDDDFSDPDKSSFRVGHHAPRSDLRFEKNLYVMRLFTGQANSRYRGKPDDVWSRANFNMRDSFACQLTGRVIAPEGCGWALLLWAEPLERSVAIRLHRDGRVEIGQFTWPGTLTSTLAAPILPPGAHPGDEFNTLLVVLRGGQTLEVYLNGSAVIRPIRLKQPLGQVDQGMALWTRNLPTEAEVRAEFKRVTLWRLTGPAP